MAGGPVLTEREDKRGGKGGRGAARGKRRWTANSLAVRVGGCSASSLGWAHPPVSLALPISISHSNTPRTHARVPTPCGAVCETVPRPGPVRAPDANHTFDRSPPQIGHLVPCARVRACGRGRGRVWASDYVGCSVCTHGCMYTPLSGGIPPAQGGGPLQAERAHPPSPSHTRTRLLQPTHAGPPPTPGPLPRRGGRLRGGEEARGTSFPASDRLEISAKPAPKQRVSPLVLRHILILHI